MEIAKIIFYLVWFVIDSFLHPSEYDRSKHPQWLKTIRQSSVLRVLAFLLIIGSIVTLATYAFVMSNKLSSSEHALKDTNHQLALALKDVTHYKSLSEVNCKLAPAASQAPVAVVKPTKNYCQYKPTSKVKPVASSASQTAPLAIPAPSAVSEVPMSLTQVRALMTDDDLVPAK